MADPVDKECLYINYNGLIVIYLSDNKSIECLDTVSYTHLDVYKRQLIIMAKTARSLDTKLLVR